MKYILLLLLPSVLFASNLTTLYGAYYFNNELGGIYPSTSLNYTTYDLAPDYSSLVMVDVIHNFTSETYYDPSPELKDLGCNRKLHITNNESFYCTDDTNQLLLAISSELPFTVTETFYLGFPNKNFDDWLDPDTQYLVFVYPIIDPNLYNFTVFNTATNQFFSPVIVNTTDLVGKTDYGIEGYFITDDVIGFGIEDWEGVRPTEVWQFPLAGSQEPSRISTTNVTNIIRIIVLNYAHIIFVNNDNLYTTEISSGNMNSYALDSTVSDINKINHTHFTVSAGTQISVFTVDANNQLVQTGSVELSSYLKINNVTLNPPDCCSGQGFLQAWVQEPEQNSYIMLDENTLEVMDYVTPYQYDDSDAPYFPLFSLGNETIVRPSFNGYVLTDSNGKFIDFVSVPLQDVYYDPSNDDLVFGFYSGATNDYPEITSCYLLVIQKKESQFTTVNFPSCPNPTKNSTLNLLDVQCDSSWNCNLVYQAVNGIYVIYEQTPYLIESKIARLGNVFAFPQYNASQVSFVGLIPDVGSVMGQVVLDSFNFETGQQLSLKVLSAYGTVAKIDANTVMFSYSYLLQTTVHVYNVALGSSVSTNIVSESLVSSLVPLAGGQSLIALTPAGSVLFYQPSGGQLSASPVNYSSLGSAFVQATGQNSFIVLTYCSGMQSLTLYSLDNGTIIEI